MTNELHRPQPATHARASSKAPPRPATTPARVLWVCENCGHLWDADRGAKPPRDDHGHVVCSPCNAAGIELGLPTILAARTAP